VALVLEKLNIGILLLKVEKRNKPLKDAYNVSSMSHTTFSCNLSIFLTTCFGSDIDEWVHA
jgi:hypothetical protein